ncbi:lipocalin family protein [Desulfuromonas acetoxidans]|uniref:Outer membrane lipoprotein Blc n=1 Tax=Desulfuromonas acetoxidans (strain DSM 684 / 11070) TaxID=281689 RepID=Q1JWN9_DESA6|nr:Lipocalin-like [Desulfuromonas acetoxidans DSM 684]
MRIISFFGIAILILTSAGCVSDLPVQPVQAFELNRYLGKWYEIARLDHFFERGLESVTAEYSLRDDGGIRVVNRGYSVQKGEWKEAIGKAYFKETERLGHLKVSFFWPFYSSYIVFYVDPGYQYAFVAGPDHSYLWLLSRTSTVSEDVYSHFLAMAEEMGFDVRKLKKVKHRSSLTESLDTP